MTAINKDLSATLMRTCKVASSSPGKISTVTCAMIGPVSTRALADLVSGRGDTVLALHESAVVPLAEIAVAQAESIVRVVGPEGGIADDELEVLIAAGAMSVRLGPTVLRTSTAAAVALGALGVLTPRWSFE